MKCWVWTLLALFFLALAPPALTAQQPTFRANTELVNVNVTVVGPDAQPIDGLTEDQFEVFEDGVKQELKFFAAGEMPLDVAIVLDTSSSMTGSLNLVQHAALRLANALRVHDRATIMSIADGLRVLQPLTHDKPAVAAAIRATRAGGRTPLYASIYTVLREFERERRDYVESRRQAIVVLTDGQDTASGFGFDELMATVRRQAVPIYTIAPRPSATIKAQRELTFGETTREQDFELRKLAAETGARAFFPVALHELAGVYDDIANELAHQYSIGYQSSNHTHDGEFRRIALRVIAPGVKWRARTGYVAASAATAGNDAQ
jgi:Ca-activated chloride channel family protein